MLIDYLTGGLLPEPEYPHRCQHCPQDIRLLENGAYVDRNGFMRCRKDMDHAPMPEVPADG